MNVSHFGRFMLTFKSPLFSNEQKQGKAIL
jgi:hypothetical protein